jgi:sterol O-acyltransferase
MSTSAEPQLNGYNKKNHPDNILRPRAVKPGNPAVLRTQGEDGLLAVNGNKEAFQHNANISGQTRYNSHITSMDYS